MRKVVCGIILLGMLLATGCGHTFYRHRMPIIELPDRPKLDDVPSYEMDKMGVEARESIVSNLDKLILHIRKLEVGIGTYNEYAEEQNEKLGGKTK